LTGNVRTGDGPSFPAVAEEEQRLDAGFSMSGNAPGYRPGGTG
jgi:hypothetical protein